MYTIIIAVATALAVAVGGYLQEWWGWIWACLIAPVVFIIVAIAIVRVVMKKVQPVMMHVKRQLEAQMIKPAIDSLETLLPSGKWIPMLRGQLLAQIGIYSYHAKDEAKAIKVLDQAPLRVGEAQLMRAAIHYKKNEHAAAVALLDKSAPYQKKSAFFHNVRAWMLHKQKDNAGAIARLAPFVQKSKHATEATKDNLLRLQNGKKMTMAPFDMQWYMLGLETPRMQQQQMPGQHVGRKGFRQPSKKRG